MAQVSNVSDEVEDKADINMPSTVSLDCNEVKVEENSPSRVLFDNNEIKQIPKVSTNNLPLEEAARLEVMRLNTGDRTPVSLMQELLSRRGTAPKYELIQIEGAINEPIFKYRISLTSESRLYVAIGSGKSKKEAKHNAAKSVLDQLIGRDDEKLMCQKENLFKVEPNPVGQLQEACMTRKWPPPVYETEETTGLPHERMFTVCAYVNVYKEEGMGKSKKIAKREAALNMLKFLETVPIEIPEKKQGEDVDEKGESNGLKHTHDSTFLTPQILKKIQQYHTVFSQKTKGPLLEKLLSTRNLIDEVEDPILYLEDLSDELKYRVSFVDIEEKSKADGFQSLLQLTTTPVTVFCGTGASIEVAKIEAVYRALDFLQIMNR
ncbi:hypothetical protein M8J76_001520 [Diaphorina citri]|nr:hypothetical protein M8J75_015736 [Diaphorina citri]KAI5740199.1 hypothetical protein M8J76_001520 [Diaphorina citri]